MKLKDAIDIGRNMNRTTIGEVDDLICYLYNEHQIFTEQQMQEYIEDYDLWRKEYEQQFPNENFEDVKI